MIRVFECINGIHNKFWSIEIEEDEYCFYIKTVYGKIGTNGQSSFKQFGTKEIAYKNASNLIKSKQRKGYIEKTQYGDY